MKTNSSHTFGRRSLLAVGVLAATAGAGLAWWRLTPKTARSQEIEAFWSSRFEQPSGAELDLKALRGQPLLVNFWATWCPPCVEELPMLDAFSLEHAGKGFQVRRDSNPQAPLQRPDLQSGEPINCSTHSFFTSIVSF